MKMDSYVQVKVILGSYGSTTELSGWQSKHAKESSTEYIPIPEYYVCSCLSHTTALKPTNSLSNRFTWAGIHVLNIIISVFKMHTLCM